MASEIVLLTSRLEREQIIQSNLVQLESISVSHLMQMESLNSTLVQSNLLVSLIDYQTN